ncbi:unnamed protein product [Rotaria sordida]|uniref:Uncharacterized protein n=1 Tax=Rotaria sordida TaxID=392033 RepID=A0A815A8V3_9BILA|nr:unnamed protein product [Rotaria sordida]
MQVSWQYLLVVSLFTIVYGQLDTKNVRSISSGLSFGMCRGYCQRSINITSNPIKLIASKEPNFDQTLFPPVKQEFPFSTNQYEELISLVDLNSFTTLLDTYGCPGCADGGIEWIQVDWTDGTKRVTFESRRLVKGIEGLVVKLREMREEYVTQL